MTTPEVILPPLGTQTHNTFVFKPEHAAAGLDFAALQDQEAVYDLQTGL